MIKERQREESLIRKLQDLKYIYRDDIRDLESLKRNFREKFESLNRVNLTDSEFARLLDEIVSSDVFHCAKILRKMNAFEREDGTPLNYTLVNIKDWCKNTFEVVNQLRINTENSHQRYDVILLINGLPVVQIELKTLAISTRRVSMEEIQKNDYNLNISRYVSTAVPEPEIDLEAVHSRLVDLEKEITGAAETHNKFLKELGLPPLP